LDFPRPPSIEAVPRRIRVELGGRVIAETTRALRVLETAHPPVYYVPAEDVALEYLAPSQRGPTECELKGTAHYYAAVVGARRADPAAWSYPNTAQQFDAIRGYFGFYAGQVDACYVGDARVTPQPGEDHPGWITRDVVGPCKGEPGPRGG
jgi:uncharacterized protein (DUF427 family)